MGRFFCRKKMSEQSELFFPEEKVPHIGPAPEHKAKEASQ
jgi:hypothetical protein